MPQPFEEEHFQKIIELNCLSALKHFKKIVRSYLFIHTLFIVFFAVQLIALVVLWVRKVHPTLTEAMLLSTLVLTLFSYFVLLFYFQAKRPEQLIQLKNWFIGLCQKSLPGDIDQEDMQLAIATAARSFTDFLVDREGTEAFLRTPFLLLNRILKRLAYRFYRSDFFFINEQLMMTAIERQVDLIKLNPMNLETHAALAESYLNLANFYRAKRGEGFQQMVQQAIEEYTIIASYAHEDPWVIAQLADCYRQIEDYANEIEQYKKLTCLGEDNPEVLYRLGKLYFQHGKTADALRIYHQLKEKDVKKAALLITHYTQVHAKRNA